MNTKANFPVYCLFVFSLFIQSYAGAQTDINAFYRQSDPAREIVNPELKMQAHEEFLNRAIAEQDSFQVILGAIYLSNDLIIASDYRSAMEKLIIGSNYAEALKDTLWLGRVNHKKGTVHSLMEDHSKAIEYYNRSLTQSARVRDSQYLAITMEQLGAMHSYQGEFEKSNAPW